MEQGLFASLVKGENIYSKQFYQFLCDNGCGLYFQFCQDIIDFYDKYSDDKWNEIQKKYDMKRFGLQNYKFNYDQHSLGEIINTVASLPEIKGLYNEFLDEYFIDELWISDETIQDTLITNAGSLYIKILDGKFQTKKSFLSSKEKLLNSFIALRLGNNEFTTDIHCNTNNPFFNETMVFGVENVLKDKLYIQIMNNKGSHIKILDTIELPISKIVNTQQCLANIPTKIGVLNVVVGLERLKGFRYNIK